VKRFEAEVLKNQSRQYAIQQQIVETENRINFLVGRFPQHVDRSAQSVVTLVPPGQEAHEYEPTPKQMAGIENADVLLYLKGFESGVDDAAAALPGSVRKVDVSAGLRHGDDPHVWLDPQLMKAMTTRVAGGCA